jgi:hypothetical protein
MKIGKKITMVLTLAAAATTVIDAAISCDKVK